MLFVLAVDVVEDVVVDAADAVVGIDAGGRISDERREFLTFWFEEMRQC